MPIGKNGQWEKKKGSDRGISKGQKALRPYGGKRLLSCQLSILIVKVLRINPNQLAGSVKWEKIGDQIILPRFPE